MAPDGNYNLAITGHSLGGALATLCGFYVAARARFAHLSTVYVWTFAGELPHIERGLKTYCFNLRFDTSCPFTATAPRVGTQAFIHAYQHLERTGRIRHARFSITQDFVPLVPFCNFEMGESMLLPLLFEADQIVCSHVDMDRRLAILQACRHEGSAPPYRKDRSLAPPP